MTPVDANAEKLHFLTEAQFWIPCCDYFSFRLFFYFLVLLFLYIYFSASFFFFLFSCLPSLFLSSRRKRSLLFLELFFRDWGTRRNQLEILCEQSWAAFVFLKSKSSARIFSEERFQRYFEDNFLKRPRLPVSVKI